MNILIVEDHELTRFGLKTTFEGVEDVQVIYEANCAEKAIEIFKNNDKMERYKQNKEAQHNMVVQRNDLMRTQKQINQERFIIVFSLIYYYMIVKLIM